MDYSFFDSLLDAVFVVDENRRVKYCNESAASLCQSSVRRIIKGDGAHIYSLLKTSNDQSFVNETGELGKYEATPWEEVDLELVKKDFKGKIQLTIQPFDQAEGERRWIMTFHDVTLEENLHQKYQGELEQKEDMIRELQEARASLENYSKNLEQMVEERTQELRNANGMLKAIMDSLGQGFLVFDSSGWCGNVFTKACLDVLESDPLGQNIVDVLGLDGPMKDQFENWSKATFSAALPFESMKELAPQVYDHSKNKQIALDYFPIETEEGKLGNVVLVATDKTSEYEANLALENERLFAKMVVKLIKNRNQFADFLQGVEKLFLDVKNELDKGQNLDVDFLFRALHTLEGEAGAFHVGALIRVARVFQEKIEGVRKFGITEKDQLNIDVLRGCLEDVESTYRKFLSDHNDVFSVVLFNKSKFVEVPVQSIELFMKTMVTSGVPEVVLEKFQDEFIKQDLQRSLGHFNDVAQQMAMKQEKRLAPVLFDTQGIKIYPNQYKNLISSLVHAFRNSVDHGLETPEERKLQDKPEVGKIEVTARRLHKNNEQMIQIVIQDDGRGIDPERIRQKMIERGLNSEGMSAQELLQQIFVAGFTSRNEVSEFSGRGVGMDAIKTEVKNLKGFIQVESKLGEGTKITIEIPEISSQNVYALSA